MAKMLEAQNKANLEEKERSAREHRESLGKLLTLISKDLNEQLPKQVAKHLAPKMQELTSASHSAVQTAVKSAIPKDLLSGNLQVSPCPNNLLILTSSVFQLVVKSSTTGSLYLYLDLT